MYIINLVQYKTRKSISYDLHNLENGLWNSNMFSKLKSDFWYWINFSSDFWDFYVETFLIAKFSDKRLRVCMLLITKNLSPLIT